MGTRCETIVRQRTYTDTDTYKVDELFRFYRHWDGYPAGHGMDIAVAVEVAEKHFDGMLNNRNWCQRLMATLFASVADMEVEPLDKSKHGDLEYIYVIEGSYDWYGGKYSIDHLPVTIYVYRPEHEQDEHGWTYSSVKLTLEKGEPIFKGTASEYMEWIER